MQEELNKLKSQVQELLEWKREREKQIIRQPIDDASKAIILDFADVVTDLGNGGTALTQVYTDSNLDTHTGPKAYTDTRLLKIGDVTIEVPYLSIS